tara:strand:+ start:224 stop:481 length:258 start_codon:yes stop_codon:yes gene_type:complete
MTTEELITLIKDVVEVEISLDKDTPLIGGNSEIDSLNMVEICMALEEKANDQGFEFDSEKVMSSIDTIFKSPETLTIEYNRQMKG